MSATRYSERKHYRATISVLTPLHAGKGELLQRNVDYLFYEGSLKVLRLPRLVQEFGVDAIADLPNFQLPSLGSPKSLAKLAEYEAMLPPGARIPSTIRAFLRDSSDRPYLDASVVWPSIIGDQSWNQRLIDREVSRSESSQQKAGRAGNLVVQDSHSPAPRIGVTAKEQALLSSPNGIMAAISVTDCYPGKGPRGTPSPLPVVHEIGGWSQQLKLQHSDRVWVECCPPQTVLTGTLFVDRVPLAQKDNTQLAIGPESIVEVLAGCRARTKQLINAEHEWWRGQPAGESMVTVYDTLQAHRVHSEADEMSTLLWLGLGAHHPETRAAPRNPNDQTDPGSFAHPESRQAILSSHNRPAGPLGWVMLTLEA